MDPYVFLSFRQIHVVVYGTTSNYLTFRINFIIFLRTPCMNRARTKLLITLGKIVISIYRSCHGAEPNFTSYKFKIKSLPCSRRTPLPTRLVRHAAQGRMRVVLHFSLTSGTVVEQTDYRQTPTPPTTRWLRKHEGEEMVVARTPRKLVSDGTRVGGVCRTARREC